MKHAFLLILLSATSALAATGGGFGGSARATSPSSVVRSSPAPVVKSPPITLQTPKASPQIKTFTGSAPSNTWKPLAPTGSTPKTPTTFPSPQRPPAQVGNPTVPQSPDRLSYSTVPTPAYPHEINGRYYPHTYAYYQQHQLLGAVLLAEAAEEATATPEPAHSEGVGQVTGPTQVPAGDLTLQLREAFNLQDLDPNELRKLLVGFAWALIVGGILLFLNSLPLMMRIGNLNGVFMLVLGVLVGLGGVNLLHAVKG